MYNHKEINSVFNNNNGSVCESSNEVENTKEKNTNEKEGLETNGDVSQENITGLANVKEEEFKKLSLEIKNLEKKYHQISQNHFELKKQIIENLANKFNVKIDEIDFNKIDFSKFSEIESSFIRFCENAKIDYSKFKENTSELTSDELFSRQKLFL